VTDAGMDGFAGNAKPDGRTEAAAFIDLHDFSSRLDAQGWYGVGCDLIKSPRLRIPRRHRRSARQALACARVRVY